MRRERAVGGWGGGGGYKLAIYRHYTFLNAMVLLWAIYDQLSQLCRGFRVVMERSGSGIILFIASRENLNFFNNIANKIIKE
jgi:hypothetical protein